jgi:ATP-binding cassette subfamily A (ABC1) protein 3
MGCLTFPICLALCMPIFLHHFVMEKENKLVDNMKTNGLKMFNYWLINGVYNFISYLFTAILFFIFGRYVFDLDFFSNTHVIFFVILFIVWGLCQVSLSMFYASVFSSAQSASMTGYAFTLWTCVICSNMTVSVFAVPRRLPDWMMYYPNFPFVRAMYLLLDPCTWESCLGDIDMAPPEFYEMIGWLLFNSVLYLIVALYLNEVWPQEFGVQKHPLFPVEGLMKQFIPALHNQIFNDESNLVAFRDENELKDEDDDVR